MSTLTPQRSKKSWQHCRVLTYRQPVDSCSRRSTQSPLAGCVALRRIDHAYCEMKRMFVYPRFHGTGVGRALAERLLSDARAAGYQAMRLDTSIRQAEAKGLYQRLGFQVIKPYYELPDRMRDWLVFMELAL
jgi:ribosomal protein S18 acetylase RimI-like enzyme